MSLYPSNYLNQSNPERRRLVELIYTMMETDYGAKFTSHFKDGDMASKEKAREWKCRLLDFAQAYTDEQLVNAVDSCCLASPEFPTTIRTIQNALREADTEKRKREQQAEVSQRERLPVNPKGLEHIQALWDAAKGKASSAKKPETPEEQLQARIEWRDRVKDHELLVLSFTIAAHEKAGLCGHPDRTLKLSKAITEDVHYFASQHGLTMQPEA
jgi:hypothetical protein